MTAPERRAVGYTLSAHNQSREEFLAALAGAAMASGRPARELVLRVGPGVCRTLVRNPHTTLPGVGFVALDLDPDLEPWTVVIEAAEP